MTVTGSPKKPEPKRECSRYSKVKNNVYR